MDYKAPPVTRVLPANRERLESKALPANKERLENKEQQDIKLSRVFKD